MYGENQYGTIWYGSDIIPNSDEKYYEDLIKLVPKIITDLEEMKALYHSQGYEIGLIMHSFNEMIAQCFLKTASWGLERWEKIFGIETNLTLTYEQRREVITAKVCGQGTTTCKMIQETALAFSGGEVEVIEDNPNHHFIVRFIGVKGIPRNMKGFIDMLEEIKPAHLAYSFEYRYTVWNELLHCKWNEFDGNTWADIRVLKED